MSLDESYFPVPLNEEAVREPMLGRVAELVRATGVDPDSAMIADYFLDDTSFYFGILVTSDRRVFQFGYDHLHKSQMEGSLSEWNELTITWRSSPYREEVAAALKSLGAAT